MSATSLTPLSQEGLQKNDKFASEFERTLEQEDKDMRANRIALAVFISLAFVTFLGIPGTLVAWLIVPLSIMGPILFTISLVACSILIFFTIKELQDYRTRINIRQVSLVNFLNIIPYNFTTRFNLFKKYAIHCTSLDLSELNTTSWSEEQIIELISACPNLNLIKLGEFYAYEKVKNACKHIPTQVIGDMEMQASLKQKDDAALKAQVEKQN